MRDAASSDTGRLRHFHGSHRRLKPYEGYPALSRYSEFHAGKQPSLETLQGEQAKLARYIGAKKLELNAITKVKGEINWPEDNKPACATLRMMFRRLELDLTHDINDLKWEHDLVRDAAIEQAERQTRY